ncbi:MAG TPA: bifunctional diaminohydroxyphosphoribosylaminopyrimidine deaminase/5-amino-6-(5-phosphoribosylamino)uracil reductase RibD [Hanamia sp.]|nr:bifunctional diaminohydroxyphosphoribosylaminopyrimidine deaminase/5-amino-6-(5-phosphoribosylamino)uracil reductase RibD [Hanamia sp.]
MTKEEQYMSRCIQLAKLGAGNVAPNPMVGGVLVYENKIIGEGYHQRFGEAHAEVNCINNVAEENKSLIEKSTMYVSLEPCAHHGKTPPCSDLIIQKKIKKVIVGCQDIFKEVAGKGIEKLENAGVEVITGVLEHECRDLNRRFFTFHQKQRPYIILKWAQSANGKIGSDGNERILISNDYSNRLVHKWRSEEAAILVGTNTVLKDDPSLTTRLWKGNNPVRVVIDKELKIASSFKIFNEEAKTIVFTVLKNAAEKNAQFIKLNRQNFLKEMLHSLFENNIQSVLVEGGTKTLQSFINASLWDEARIITSKEMIIENGVEAPEMKGFVNCGPQKYFSDTIDFFYRK